MHDIVYLLLKLLNASQKNRLEKLLIRVKEISFSISTKPPMSPSCLQRSQIAHKFAFQCE